MNKTFTYFAFLIAASAAIVTPALGETMMVFSDGSRHVWSDPYVKGDEICTSLSYGTYCCRRTDLVRSYPVPVGTQATDMGMNMGAVQIDEEASRINQRYVEEMNAHARKRDAEIERSYKQHERDQRRKRMDGKSEWAQ